MVKMALIATKAMTDDLKLLENPLFLSYMKLRLFIFV